MEEKLLEIIKGIIKDKGTHPQVATIKEIRRATAHIEDKGLLNLTFREMVNSKKIRVREGVNHILVEVL